MKDVANAEALVQPWRFSWVLGLAALPPDKPTPASFEWAESAATALDEKHPSVHEERRNHGRIEARQQGAALPS